MTKISVKPYNDFCPQTLFIYGTNNEDGTPDFGLFCWFSYYWDSEMGVMCAIGGSKTTRENIEREKIFSANLVTEELLPLADYLGCTSGRSDEKMKIGMDIGKGSVLDVPVLNLSPVTYELEVKDFIPQKDGVVMLCRMRNVLQDEKLLSKDKTDTEKLIDIAPVRTTCKRYFGYKGEDLGAWGEPMKALSRD